MSLAISNLSFRDFRNYRSFDLHDVGVLTVFVGPNAVGKTNIVEGIQLLTALSSFRHATVDQLVRKGAQFARLRADVSDGARQLEISLEMGEGSKQYALNGKKKRKPDLKGLIPAVMFTPDDLSLVKGPMKVRRDALDSLGSQLTPNYGIIKKDYEKVIRYKNRLLKDGASPDLVESVNETLVTCGAQLVCYRFALFKKLALPLHDLYASLASSKEGVGACYVPSWEDSPSLWKRKDNLSREEARDALSAALDSRRGEEYARHRALVGPHADRVEFSINGSDAALFGSQGQQRSLVLAFKLAEAAVIEDMLHQKPVLLLDDVMSELDSARRAALMRYVNSGAQTFITTTNLSYFEQDEISRAHVVKVPLEEALQ